MSSHSLNSKIGIIIPSKFESEMIKIPHHVSGMGKIRATCAVYDLVAKGYTEILLAGFCGGLLGCHVGDIIIPKLFVEGDYITEPLEKYPNQIQISDFGDIMVSQDRFLKEQTYENFLPGKNAVDMESYAVAYTCLKLGIKFNVVKIVSDIVGENSEKDFLESCKTLAHKLEEVINEILISY